MSASWYPGIKAFENDACIDIRAVVVLSDGEEAPLAIETSRLLIGVDYEAYKLALNACRETEAAAPQDVEVA